MKSKINFPFLITLLAIIAIWGIYSLNNSPIIAPSPIRILKSFKGILLSKYFLINLGITLLRGLTSYAISMFIGISLGIIIGKYKTIEKGIYPIISGLNSIPRISWILLAMIWFPLNSFLVVFIIIITILPIITIGSFDGFREVPLELIEMANIYKFTQRSRISNIYLPSMLPYILSSSRVAAGITWKSIIMAELLTVESGIGSAMGAARASLATDKVISYTIIIVIICYLHQKIITILEQRILKKRESL